MSELIDLLNRGIQLKREGRYDDALECYSKAIAMDKEDRRAYVNSARMFLGMRKYERALRYFLVGCVYDRLYGNYDQNPAYQLVTEHVKESLQSKAIKLSNIQISADMVLNKCEKNLFMGDLLFDSKNFAFYIGHAVVALNDFIMVKHSIPQELMRNLEYNLLGKPRASDLRDTDKEYVFLICALLFADRNCTDSFTSVESAADHYLSSDTRLDYELSSSANARGIE
jgi:tetratricopeptide (TPR) repeat protein